MCGVVMKHKKWSNCPSSTQLVGTGMPRPCCMLCRQAIFQQYSVSLGIYSRISLSDNRSAIIDRICLFVSQLIACWYASDSKNSIDFPGFLFPAFPGVKTLGAATITFVALDTCVFFVMVLIASHAFWWTDMCVLHPTLY